MADRSTFSGAGVDDRRLTLAGWARLVWQDGWSGEVYGESTEIEATMALCRRLAVEPIIDGERRLIELYEEPRHRLLRRFHPDGVVEVVAEPYLADEISRAADASAVSDIGHGSDPRGVLLTPDPVRLQQARAYRELCEKRRLAGLPEDGCRGLVGYTVAVDRSGQAVFFELERERAVERAGEGGLVLVDSRTWQPITV